MFSCPSLRLVIHLASGLSLWPDVMEEATIHFADDRRAYMGSFLSKL